MLLLAPSAAMRYSKVFCSSGKSLAKVKQDSSIVVFQQDLVAAYLDTAIEQ
jgi:hypothetical protein